MPDSQVLLSNVEDWHFVLNRWYLSRSEAEAEAEAFDADLAANGIPYGWPYPEPFQSHVMDSWPRIFDLDQTGREPAWTHDPKHLGIQATFWRLDPSHVRRIERFIAR